jgi:hypothetical protein
MDIFAELEKLRLEHEKCNDHYYSCELEKSDACILQWFGPGHVRKCTCGADGHNAILDRVIAYLRESGHKP